MMTKHQTIMQMSEGQAFTGLVIFEQEEIDGEVTEQVCITEQNWEDLGNPDVITVTVEPGDILNVDGEF